MRGIVGLLGIGLFALLSIFFIAFGVLYAAVDELLWFHAAAIPDVAREAVRPLYFALMDLIGAASVGLGVLGLYVTAVPLRRGGGTALALAGAFATPLIGAAVVAERLARLTGAPTSWHIMGGLLALTMTALGCSVWGVRNAATAGDGREARIRAGN